MFIWPKTASGEQQSGKEINLNSAEVQNSNTLLFSLEAQPVKSQIQQDTQPELNRLKVFS